MEIRQSEGLFILKFLLEMLRLLSFAMLLTAAVAVYYGEWEYAAVFAIPALTLYGAFSPMQKLMKPGEARLRHAVIAIVLAWFLYSIIAMLPLSYAGLSPVDSLFESISGWTGTGLTMIPHPEVLPKSINFWRGLIQWIGGLGVVVMALFVYDKPRTAQALFTAEGRAEDFYLDFFKVAKKIAIIYSALTFLCALLLFLAGVPIFDSVVHAMTTLPTGGYSTRPEGIGFFGFIPTVVLLVFMFLGGVSFIVHNHIFSGRLKQALSNSELHFYILAVALSTALIWANLVANHAGQYYDGLFYAVSSISGTGATTLFTPDNFPGFSIAVLILLMTVGGSYGSTTSALKIWRLMIGYAVVKREVMKSLLPKDAVIPIKIGGVALGNDAVMSAMAYILIYVLLIIGGVLAFMAFGHDILSSLYAVSAAQGNSGLQIYNIFELQPALKLLLSFHMFVGRLEILPVLVLIRGAKGVMSI